MSSGMVKTVISRSYSYNSALLWDPPDGTFTLQWPSGLEGADFWASTGSIAQFLGLERSKVQPSHCQT